MKGRSRNSCFSIFAPHPPAWHRRVIAPNHPVSPTKFRSPSDFHFTQKSKKETENKRSCASTLHRSSIIATFPRSKIFIQLLLPIEDTSPVLFSRRDVVKKCCAFHFQGVCVRNVQLRFLSIAFQHRQRRTSKGPDRSEGLPSHTKRDCFYSQVLRKLFFPP